MANFAKDNSDTRADISGEINLEIDDFPMSSFLFAIGGNKKWLIPSLRQGFSLSLTPSNVLRFPGADQRKESHRGEALLSLGHLAAELCNNSSGSPISRQN